MSTSDNSPGFYLGREYDLANQTVLDEPIVYDPRDLLTHGVVVGMTGSGKTGLCIDVLEEAALRGIPSVIIDLKGDLSNLLLNFPDMRPEDFEPWVHPDEARRNHVSIEEEARHLSETWRQGIAEWGMDLERVGQLRQSADWRIYTPGSEAGLPVSVIQNFNAPKGDVGREILNDKVEATTTALLGLMNIPADPVQSREHILVANLLLNAWSAGKDLDLPRLIAQIQSPPLRKIGTFDVDMFFPEADRLKLAVTLNNLLASPTFSTWITGDPLDLASMLYAPDGRPRQLIFYLAHLDDAQRMFFLSLLLQEVLTWTRSQPGSMNLRALVYFDELYGYMPPYPANPPTKQPLLTLLKQARAFGVGVLLATQNPVDLDYKALTNAGTWFVGKLRTDRDKDRLLEGLEGVAAEQGTLADRAYLDTAISALGNRVFLLHDVHRPKPVLFQTRWSLSYLHGPLTRDQVALLRKSLEANRPPEPAVAPEAPPAAVTPSESPGVAIPPSSEAACPQCAAELPADAKFCMKCGALIASAGAVPAAGLNGEAPPAPAPTPEAAAVSPTASAHVPPVLPPGTVQFFLPVVAEQVPPGAALVYQPRLLGFAEVTLTDRTRKHRQKRTAHLLTLPPEPGMPVDWDGAEHIPDALSTTLPEHEATWADVPETVNDPKKLKALEKSLVKQLYDRAGGTAFFNAALDMVSHPGETEEQFRVRCRAAAHDRITAELAELDAHLGPESERGKVQDRWRRQAEHVREVRLGVRKADISVTHFGLAWAPFAQVANGEGPTLQPVYERKEPVRTAAGVA